MKIEPTYVTFEQAKLLKEKGYIQKPTKLSEPYYNYNGELNGDMLEYIKSYVAKNKKDLVKYSSVAAPEQWQVVEWLRVNHGIWVYVRQTHDNNFCFEITGKEGDIFNMNKTPQEAYSTAFDYILKQLI